MFASEFNKAKEEQEKISKMVDEISSKIAAFPGLYEKAKNVLPRAINEVRLHIKELQEKDIDLSYLEPEEKLTTIQSALSSSIDQWMQVNLKWHRKLGNHWRSHSSITR